MASSPSAIKAQFHGTISDHHLRGLAMSLWASYPESYDTVGQHMLRDQAHDVRGHFRRGLAERNFKAYGRRIAGAVVHQERNSTGSYNHVVIEVGDIILTQSHAESPNDIIQHADFRKSYAESAQGNLYTPTNNPAQSNKLYAMILHGPGASPKQPAFIAAVFPTNDCKTYVYDATVNLFVRFEDLATAIRNDQTEVISDDLMLDLRRLDEDVDAASA